MKKLTNTEKIALIKKYYKKKPMFLELTLENYENYNMYICINEIKENDIYRLSWFDLDEIGDDIEKYMSCVFIPYKTIDIIKKVFSNYIVGFNYHEELLTDENVVTLKANIITKASKEIDVSFKKYLPRSLAHLDDLLIFIFKNMPKKYEGILFEMLAALANNVERYEYKKEFKFDLFRGNIDKLFSPQICERGKKYHEESFVKFLEKIDDRYFAIVGEENKYLVIIKYNHKRRKMQVYCSCPCEFYCKHMYAVILAIRAKEFNRFYKIMYRNPDKDLFDRIMDFDYYLCIGIVEQNFLIINHYGEFELIPILDTYGRYNWEVLEDSEDEKLAKEIKYFLDNK